MDIDVLLGPTIREQFGLVSRKQAKAAGMSDRQIGRRVERGVWERVDHGVFRHHTATTSWHGELMRVHLATGALASHRAAGALWGTRDMAQPPVELSVARGYHRWRKGVTLHESTQFELAGATTVDGVPCTGLLRTVLDQAAVLQPTELNHVVDAALRRSDVDWPDLYRVLARHSRQGRDGCGHLRSLLDDRYGETAIPDSKWNRWVAELLVDAGLPEPKLEFEVHDHDGFIARVDLAYPDALVAVELDSVRWHHNLEAFGADRRKRNRLLSAGWQVFAFTWRDYVDRPDELCALIADSVGPAEPRGCKSPAISTKGP